MEIKEILKRAVEQNASDIFLIGGLPITYKVYGHFIRENENKLIGGKLNDLVDQIYQLANRENNLLNGKFEDDFSFAISGLARFRINSFYQRGSVSAIIRVLQFGIPDPLQLHIPQQVMNLANENKGLIIVAGPTGSGKSTTLACLIDKINENYEKNIITMEDPIEFIHHHKKSIVIQREISTDTESYLDALRASLRESPDVLLIGEMRDQQTISTALTAAETGRLVISTLHTSSISDTIDRIVDSFPSIQQSQIKIQLSKVLTAVACQQLVPGIDEKLYPIFELMHNSPAVMTMIREGRTHQLNNVIKEERSLGNITLNDSLLELVKENIVEKSVAKSLSPEPTVINKYL